MLSRWNALCVLSLCAGGSFSFAAAPLEKLTVYPPDVNLATARSKQTFVVQATFADGISRDVTAEAKIAFSKPELVARSQNLLTPTADGACEMTVEFGGQSVKVPVVVK